MNSTLTKLILALVGLVAVAATVTIIYLLVPSATPVQPQQSSGGPTYDQYGNVVNVTPGTGTTSPNQSSTTTPVQTAADDLRGIPLAYDILFKQLPASKADFQTANASSTGDYKALYALYASDVKLQQKNMPHSSTDIQVALVDLTGDGTPEAIVNEVLPYFCGTAGCPLDIYKKSGTKWSKVFSTTVGGEIGLGDTIANGYLDLYLTVPVEGQSNRSVVALYRWSGSTYVLTKVVAAWNGATFDLAK